MPRLLALTVFMLMTFSVSGQLASRDSLQNVIDATRDPRKKVDLLNNIAFENFHFATRDAFEYATQAYDLAEEIQYVDGKRYALIFKGFYYSSSGSYRSALQAFFESRALEQKEDDMAAYNLVHIGNAYQALCEYDSSENFYRQAIAMQKRTGSDRYVAYTYKNYGRLLLMQWKNTEAIEVFEKSVEYYQKRKSRVGIAEVWFAMADAYRNLADIRKSESYVEKGCAMTGDGRDEFLSLQCKLHKGEQLYDLGSYGEAIKIYIDALQILERVELPRSLTKTYINLGDAYEALGYNDVALEYFFKALKSAEPIGIRYELAEIYNSIAWMYKNQHNFPLAKEYNQRSLAIRKGLHDTHGISACFNVRGLIFFEEGQYDSSLVYIDRAIDLRTRIRYRNGLATSLYNKALLFEQQKRFEEALELQLKALALAEDLGNRFDNGISYNNIGNLYTQLRDYKQASFYLKKGSDMARETGSRSLRMNNYLYWSIYFEKKGNLAEALRYHKRYSQINDSVYYDVGSSKLAELQALYQIEKKDQEIALLSKEKELQENAIRLQRSQINLQMIIIVSGLVGFLLLMLFFLKTYQYNRRIKRANKEILEQKEEIQAQSEELKEAHDMVAEINRSLEVKIAERTQALSQAYKELDTFFYRASHDFRRPLTTFLGLAEVANVTVKDSTALELFEKVRVTAISLDQMLIKLQSISDVGSPQLVFREVDLFEMFENIAEDHRDTLETKGIRTITDIQLHKPFVSYPAMVKIIMDNLFENAIHFAGFESPYIRLRAFEEGQRVVFQMEDNGQGIAAEYHGQIFDMYFRASERSKGNGLGLYITKKAVEKLEGSIRVDSVYGVGTTFTVSIPNAFSQSFSLSADFSFSDR